MYADTLICSHPRSGGRWLRYLLAHYLAEQHRLDVEVTPQTVFAVIPDHHDEWTRGYPAFQFRDRRDLPLIAACHQPFSSEFHRAYPVIFLARNAYDVAVSAFFYFTREKTEYTGTIRDFVRHPKLGVPAWVEYMNSWAPKLLTHRDCALVSYRELNSDPARALSRVLEFLHQTPDPVLVHSAVESGNAFRSARGIRTGQEGNFWDHLDPESIFDIQEIVHRDLSEHGAQVLGSIGVEMDPFPRADA